MIKIRALELVDFGPYKGRQRVEIAETGVTIFYGENGTGKTLLLNGLRFVLFGHVLGRGSTQKDLAVLANWESCAGRTPEFQVSLEIDADSIPYELSRRFGPVGSSGELHTVVSLVKGGVPLGPDEATAELNRLIPETISRFFLFDGELLQQYEELLHSESEVGEKIRMSIERILGVPVLTQARDHLSSLLGVANKETARNAERDERTRQAGQSMLNAQNMLDSAQANIAQLERHLNDLIARKEELEAQLSRYERTSRLMAQRDQITADVATFTAQRVEGQNELSQMASNLWRPIVAPQMRQMAEGLRVEIATLEAREAGLILANARMKALQADGMSCPTCHQPLTTDLRAHLLEEFRGDEVDEGALKAQLHSMRKRHEVVARLGAGDEEERLESVLAKIGNAEAGLAERRGRLSVIDQQLGSVPESDIRAMANELAQVSQSESNTRERISQERREAGELGTLIENLRSQIERAGGGGGEIAQRRAGLLRSLEALFDSAVGEYRDRLQREVEERATVVFRMLSHQLEYERLLINDQYGLTIVHRDGTEIPWRSAGFEHLVALSLIAALQQSAPITGPIIMDSPFQRLDKAHVESVVAHLPELAEQVILLVYERELDRPMAITHLGGHLRKEYVLNQLSAKHTEIEVRTGR